MEKMRTTKNVANFLSFLIWKVKIICKLLEEKEKKLLLMFMTFTQCNLCSNRPAPTMNEHQGQRYANCKAHIPSLFHLYRYDTGLKGTVLLHTTYHTLFFTVCMT